MLLFLFVTKSCRDSLRPHGASILASLCLWDFPRQECWNELPFPLQRIFPTQGQTYALLSRQILSIRAIRSLGSLHALAPDTSQIQK